MSGTRQSLTQRILLLEELLIGQSGHVSSMQPLDDFYNDEPRGQGWVAQLPPNTHRPLGTAHSPRATGGRGRGVISRLKALMEAAERICLSTVPKERLRYGSAVEFDNCIPAEAFPAPWRDSSVWQSAMHWCSSTRIGRPSSDPVLVPAQLVYCPYGEPDEEALLWDPSSNGAAAGFSLDEAAARATREAFERHIIVLSHYLQLGGQELDWRDLALDPGSYAMGMEATALGLQVRVTCLVKEPFPVVVCCAIDPSGRFPALTTGSACGVSVEQAASGAMSEALHARRQARDFLVNAPVVDVAALETIEERVVYWGMAHSAGKLDYLFGNSMPLDGAYTDGYLDEGYVVDITTPLFAEAGIAVVKVVYPRLQPMFFSESRKRILGAPDQSATASEPHPYA
ncbi:YcaO-like family protein [Streptomyces sp. AC550_RSS872]|uniref:YcaO-like family protein n=1 Tax=Streptomyces sp. AC550_RSS872 TaxID=2823689 RepID=UPI001C26D26D|nr:YcaO-like family protein [Streptomyces sp. AC550_RSS872]